MTGHVPNQRSVDFDVVRAIALIGVCAMNYHGFLNPFSAGAGTGFFDELFDPWSGPLSTRFAATFVTVAGIGVVLLTRRAVASGDPEAIADVRWILIRRGVLLFSFGYVLDWIWPGTILFFYGAYFVVAAALFTVRSRWLVVVGAGAAVAAAGLQWWALTNPAEWLLEGESEWTRSPRDLLFDVAVRGTHPLLPWLAFLCLGMVLGRMLPWRTELQLYLVFGGAMAVVLGYGLAGNLPWADSLQTTHPFDRGLLYVLTTLGTSVIAVVGIGAAARATATNRITQALAAAGRTTLTLYVLHVVVFNLLVKWWDWIEFEAGLGVALALAAGYWVVAIVLADLWQRRYGLGPLERLYRRFSD